MQNSSSDKNIKLISRVRYRAMGEEGVLVHLDNGRVIVVNEVGLYIVQQLDTPMTREDLIAAVAGEFDTSLDQTEKDIDAFLTELDAEQIIEQNS